MQQYPKCLYLDGDVMGAHVVVKDEAEEAVAREAGHRMRTDDQPEPDGKGSEQSDQSPQADAPAKAATGRKKAPAKAA